MALNSLYCADVPLSSYSLTHCINSTKRFLNFEPMVLLIRAIGLFPDVLCLNDDVLNGFHF